MSFCPFVILLFVCLFMLRLNVAVNKFSGMLGRSRRFLGITSTFRGVKCLAQGHNTAEVDFEHPTSRSGVRRSTTEPPRSPFRHSVIPSFREQYVKVLLNNLSRFCPICFQIFTTPLPSDMFCKLKGQYCKIYATL